MSEKSPPSRLSLSRLSLWIIKVYQAATANRHRVCRFEPTCSAYASEAIAVHGFWRGWGYAARRLSRCRPGGGMGYDPVPETPDQRIAETRDSEALGNV